eukprot:gb/GECH01002326.1/.p1 GENE.gb/GECH01002326.1/~~gb/GECH01002326.1/.p1  ORF type:complete len:290 (+),score=42.35 gb/GECH01002326.1/:1-870(+)
MDRIVESVCFSTLILFLTGAGTYLALNASIPLLPALMQIITVPIMSTLALLMLTSYFKCMLTEPGFVPMEWKKPPSINEELQALKTNRFCSNCNTYKPLRAHHCSSLDRCVLRMDHYCIWVCNCVGARNHKYFYLFIGYTSLTLLGFIAISIYAFIITIAELQSNPKLMIEQTSIGIIHFLLLIIFTVIMFPFMIMASAFFAWHTKLILDNKTTIEYYARDSEGKWIPNIFDISWGYNFRSVLGNTIWMWPFPIAPQLPHDGIHFPTNTANEKLLSKISTNYDSDSELI